MSFSEQVKAEIFALPIKSICCRKAFLIGLLFAAAAENNRPYKWYGFHIPNDPINFRSTWRWSFYLRPRDPKAEERGGCYDVRADPPQWI